MTFTTLGTVGADVTTFTHAGFAAGTHYWYRVRAYGSGKDTAFTPERDASFPPLTAAAPPLAVTG